MEPAFEHAADGFDDTDSAFFLGDPDHEWPPSSRAWAVARSGRSGLKIGIAGLVLAALALVGLLALRTHASEPSAPGVSRTG
jgi:hypothetical protein